MKKTFMLVLLVIAALLAADYADLTQSAKAGWGPAPSGKAAAGRGRGASAGRAARPLEEETPKLHLDWEEATIEYPVPEDEDVDKDDVDPIISQFEKAFEQQKPIIVFIYTDDMRKKYESKRKACEKYMSDVLDDAKVAEQLENFIRIKISYSKIDDDSKLRREYKLKKLAPYVAFYDFTGDQYSKTSNSNVDYIVSKLKYCIKKNEKEIKKLEKKRERERD